MSEQPLIEKAASVLREKDQDKQVQMLDEILDNLLEVAEASHTLDLMPYILGIFVAAPNEPVLTAEVIRKTQLLQKVPVLKDKAKFIQLMKGTEEGIKGYIKTSSGEVEEVKITFNLQALVKIADERYGKIHQDKITGFNTFGAAEQFINLI